MVKTKWLVSVRENATQRETYFAGIQTFKGSQIVVSFKNVHYPHIKKFKTKGLANNMVAELTLYFGGKYHFEVIEELEANLK